MKHAPYILMATLCALNPQAAAAQEHNEQSIAVFPCELYDTSGGGEASIAIAQKARLPTITAFLRQKMDESSAYRVLETAPAADLDSPYARLVEEGLFRECNGCEAELAKAIGAELSMSCFIHKVSNLILSMNLILRATADGHVLDVHSADMRGNDDTSWQRTARWLLKNRIFEPPHLREERERRLRGDY